MRLFLQVNLPDSIKKKIRQTLGECIAGFSNGTHEAYGNSSPRSIHTVDQGRHFVGASANFLSINTTSSSVHSVSTTQGEARAGNARCMPALFKLWSSARQSYNHRLASSKLDAAQCLSPVPHDVFDEAAREIYNLMANDPFPRFRKEYMAKLRLKAK